MVAILAMAKLWASGRAKRRRRGHDRDQSPPRERGIPTVKRQTSDVAEGDIFGEGLAHAALMSAIRREAVRRSRRKHYPRPHSLAAAAVIAAVETMGGGASMDGDQYDVADLDDEGWTSLADSHTLWGRMSSVLGDVDTAASSFVSLLSATSLADIMSPLGGVSKHRRYGGGADSGSHGAKGSGRDGRGTPSSGRDSASLERENAMKRRRFIGALVTIVFNTLSIITIIYVTNAMGPYFRLGAVVGEVVDSWTLPPVDHMYVVPVNASCHGADELVQGHWGGAAGGCYCYSVDITDQDESKAPQGDMMSNPFDRMFVRRACTAHELGGRRAIGDVSVERLRDLPYHERLLLPYTTMYAEDDQGGHKSRSTIEAMLTSHFDRVIGRGGLVELSSDTGRARGTTFDIADVAGDDRDNAREDGKDEGAYEQRRIQRVCVDVEEIPPASLSIIRGVNLCVRRALEGALDRPLPVGPENERGTLSSGTSDIGANESACPVETHDVCGATTGGHDANGRGSERRHQDALGAGAVCTRRPRGAVNPRHRRRLCWDGVDPCTVAERADVAQGPVLCPVTDIIAVSKEQETMHRVDVVDVMREADSHLHIDDQWALLLKRGGVFETPLADRSPGSLPIRGLPIVSVVFGCGHKCIHEGMSYNMPPARVDANSGELWQLERLKDEREYEGGCKPPMFAGARGEAARGRDTRFVYTGLYDWESTVLKAAGVPDELNGAIVKSRQGHEGDGSPDDDDLSVGARRWLVEYGTEAEWRPECSHDLTKMTAIYKSFRRIGVIRLVYLFISVLLVVAFPYVVSGDGGTEGTRQSGRWNSALTYVGYVLIPVVNFMFDSALDDVVSEACTDVLSHAVLQTLGGQIDGMKSKWIDADAVGLLRRSAGEAVG